MGNNRFIVNKDILPKTERCGIDWINIKEIEVYFTDDDKSYLLKVEDIVKYDKNYTYKILLSYNNENYKKYVQVGQILNGNFEYMFNYFNIRGNKLRPYRLSDDGTYWIGITDKDEEFYFNGEYSKEIMKYNWYVSNGYIVTKNIQVNIRLNRLVLGVTDRNIVVNHCGGNKMDNRVEKLSMSDHEDNAKEHNPSKLNNTGITGLMFNKGNNKYNISCLINGFSYTHTYKTKDEALINLLIIQRNYRYRHNENLYYMLDDIDDEYIDKLINKVEKSIGNRKVNPIICKNRFEISEDGSFYYMYDKKNNRCKISIKDIDLVKQGNWHHTLNNGKDYFSGGVIVNGKRKNIFLHRFLFDLVDTKYRHWYIDHLDSDGLNNTRDNLVITDAQGNGLNKKAIRIKELGNGKFKYRINFYKKIYSKVCNTHAETEELKNKILSKLMKNRIEFKTKEELDNYL